MVVGSLAGAMGGLMIMMPGVFGALTRLAWETHRAHHQDRIDDRGYDFDERRH